VAGQEEVKAEQAKTVDCQEAKNVLGAGGGSRGR